MTLIELYAGQFDYSRYRGVRLILGPVRVTVGRADGKWVCNGSLFYNRPAVTWSWGLR